MNEGSRARAEVVCSRIISEFKRGRHRIANGATDVPQMGCDLAYRPHACAASETAEKGSLLIAAAIRREPRGRCANESVVGTQRMHCGNRRRPHWLCRRPIQPLSRPGA